VALSAEKLNYEVLGFLAIRGACFRGQIMVLDRRSTSRDNAARRGR
jgi:hypothetical protein